MAKAGESAAFEATSMHDWLIGQIIAEKYKIVRFIGHGGMGSVYESRHLLLDRTIAIKVIQGDLAEEKRNAERFLREAKATAKIEHPNAVTIHDFGIIFGDIAYIVMEYIRGRTLRQWLNANGKCDPAQTIEWLSQACSAVSAAHSKKIVHRDLKPENIMLKDVAGGEPLIKVVDFGLAKVICGDGTCPQRLTRTSEVIGTPYYMAPEYYNGDEIDGRADIYALGIIAYEMLKGKTPFTGTIEAIIGGHLFKDPVPLHITNSEIPKKLSDVILKSLHKNRDDRFETADKFAEALRASIPYIGDPSDTASVSQELFNKSSDQITPKESIITLLSFDAVGEIDDEIGRISQGDISRETALNFNSIEPDMSSDQENLSEQMTPLLNKVDTPTLPTERPHLNRAPVTSFFSQANKRRLFITMGLVLVLLAGLGTAAFWFNTGYRKTPAPAVESNIKVQPQPVDSVRPAVVIQEVPDSSEINKTDSKSLSNNENTTQTIEEKKTPATAIKNRRQNRSSSQLNLDKSDPISASSKSSSTLKPAEELTEKDKKEKKDKKKKGIFGKVKDFIF
jgi:serine/threonine protein kinase